MTTFQFRTISKAKLALAYGFSREQTLVKRIADKLNTLDDKELKSLGQWRGKNNLLPDQVKVVFNMLGTPQHPEMVYTEKKHA